jgi:hypothetical protein
MLPGTSQVRKPKAPAGDTLLLGTERAMRLSRRYVSQLAALLKLADGNPDLKERAAILNCVGAGLKDQLQTLGQLESTRVNALVALLRNEDFVKKVNDETLKGMVHFISRKATRVPQVIDAKEV